MRAINRAIEDAAMFKDMMEKIEQPPVESMAEKLLAHGGAIFHHENRQQRRSRERAEKKAAQRSRVSS